MEIDLHFSLQMNILSQVFEVVLDVYILHTLVGVILSGLNVLSIEISLNVARWLYC